MTRTHMTAAAGFGDLQRIAMDLTGGYFDVPDVMCGEHGTMSLVLRGTDGAEIHRSTYNQYWSDEAKRERMLNFLKEVVEKLDGVEWNYGMIEDSRPRENEVVLTVDETVEAIVRYVRGLDDIDDIARLFEEVSGFVKARTCFSDPQGGDQIIGFQIDTEAYPDYDEAKVRKELGLLPTRG